MALSWREKHGLIDLGDKKVPCPFAAKFWVMDGDELQKFMNGVLAIHRLGVDG